MNRRNKIILLSGGIALTATIIITWLSVEDWSGLIKRAFLMLLWSEVVFFGVFLLMEWLSLKTEQVIARSALYVLAFGYALINICVCLLYMTLFKKADTSFTIIQIALLAITIIVAIISLTVSKGTQEANKRTMAAVANIEAMIERLNRLAVCPEYKEFAVSLKKLSQDLRFTDVSMSIPEDGEIGDIISMIELEIKSQNADENIEAALVRLNSLISQRRILTSVAKKGRI